MTHSINEEKLKASAERLEWVLGQYPSDDAIENLYNALSPLIEASKSGEIVQPIEKVPCGHSLAEGTYRRYQNPSVEQAYVEFVVELEGGLTEEDRERIADTQAMINRAKNHD